MKTFRFRLKNKNISELNRMAGVVNFVWNYCNRTTNEYLYKKYRFLSGYDLQKLTKGCSKDLQISSQTIKVVCQEYATRRQFSNKIKLAWRSSKRNLGWIPFKFQDIKVTNENISYKKLMFRFWQSRPIEGKIKSGSFSQGSRGRWYINLTCEVEAKSKFKSGGAVGIDLGLKTLATLSNGEKLTRENLTKKYEGRLAMAQRAGKNKLTKAIHAKIRNTRKDWAHKTTTKLINQYDQIFVGNVSPSKLKKTRMAKSVTDVSWADFKTMLAYKAIALGVEYKEVNESYSTVTCSACHERTGPKGLSQLGVREWTCSCGVVHDRDTNAAQNILRLGFQTPIKGRR